MCNHKPRINFVNINKNITCDNYSCKKCNCSIRLKKPIKKRTSFILAAIKTALILQIINTVMDFFNLNYCNIRSFLISVALIIIFSFIVYFVGQIVLISLTKWVEIDEKWDEKTITIKETENDN